MRTLGLARNVNSSLVELLPPAFSSVLLTVAVTRDGAHDLAWVALVPLAWLSTCSRLTSLSYAATLVAGASFHYFGMDWLRDSGNYGLSSSWSKVVWSVLSAFFLGSSWIIAVSATAEFYNRLKLTRWGSFGLAWVLGEFVRWHMAAILAETGFPWLQIAMTQVHHDGLLQVSDLGGAWLISGVVASVNGLWLDLFECARQARSSPSVACWRSIVAAIVVFALLAMYGACRLSQTQPAAGPCVWLMPRNTFTDSEQTITESISRLKRYSPSPDILLWPEWALPRPIILDHLRTDCSLSPLQNYAAEEAVALIIGFNRRESTSSESRSFNSVLIVDPLRQSCDWYDKISLVPWHEFMPWLSWPGTARPRIEFGHGSECAVHPVWCATRRRDYSVAVTICFDTCFPSVHRKCFRGSRKPDLFAECSSERFDVTMRGQSTLLAHARLRAVECRRAIVRNVYYGNSAVIDGNGEVRFLAHEHTLTEPVCAGRIPIDDRFSLYVWTGDWLPWSALVVWLYCMVQPILIWTRLEEARLELGRT